MHVMNSTDAEAILAQGRYGLYEGEDCTNVETAHIIVVTFAVAAE
jgi:hypothetical protein